MLLSDKELRERIDLYETLIRVRHEVLELEKAIPRDAPDDLLVGSEKLDNTVNEAMIAIVKRDWEILRGLLLSDARAKLAEIENRVAKFEAGEEV